MAGSKEGASKDCFAATASRRSTLCSGAESGAARLVDTDSQSGISDENERMHVKIQKWHERRLPHPHARV
jgi:hypothetical protein